jgi:uncharacterized membrane-anchored protein YitT (DUF2179 family)
MLFVYWFLLAAIGLEIFLVPIDIVDGGITGISIMTSFLTKVPLGAIIFTFNPPFLIMGCKLKKRAIH